VAAQYSLWPEQIHDVDLAERAKGDPAALSLLLRRYRPLIAQIAGHDERCICYIEDRLQRRLVSYCGHGRRKFAPWLRRVSWNLARDFFKSPQSRGASLHLVVSVPSPITEDQRLAELGLPDGLREIARGLMSGEPWAGVERFWGQEVAGTMRQVIGRSLA
jgi:DNA-directed RNA polymerase specialized sigma24 family protein